jgi:hypothetical protein
MKYRLREIAGNSSKSASKRKKAPQTKIRKETLAMSAIPRDLPDFSILNT